MKHASAWRRWSPIAALASSGLGLFSADPAAAQDDLDTELVRPTAHRGGFITSPGTHIDPNPLELAAWFQLERAPLVVVGEGTAAPEVVPLRVALQLGAMATLDEGLALAAAIPLYAMSSGWPEYPVPPIALGDMQVTGLWHFLDLGPFSLALTADLLLPTATQGALVGEGGLRLAPGAVLETHLGPVALMTSASVMLRAPVRTGHRLDVGSELSWVLGAASADPEAVVRWMAELHLRIAMPGLDAPGPDPVLLLGGLELHPFASSWAISLAGGTALTRGYGAADVRALVGLRVAVSSEDDSDSESVGPVEAWEPPHQQLSEEDLEEVLRLPPELEVKVSRLDPTPSSTATPCAPLGEAIPFELGSARLEPAALRRLASIADTLRRQPFIIEVILEGHASIEGGSEPNWILSQERAAAVYRYLVDAGVSPRRLALRGLGEADRPARTAATEVRAEDRRVNLCIARALDELEEIPGWARDATPAPWLEPRSAILEAPR